MDFMRKEVELVGVRYMIPECFADPMRFPKKFLENTELPAKCDMMPLNALTVWVNSAFPEKEGLKVHANRTHWDPIFSSVTPARDRNGRQKEIALYLSLKTLIANHKENLYNMNNRC